MQFLALEISVPSITPGQFTPELKRAESRGAWELYQDGIIRELYFRADRPEAVVMLECPDAAAAQAILGSLPLVAAGLIAFDLIPLQPYPGFARLFKE